MSFTPTRLVDGETLTPRHAEQLHDQGRFDEALALYRVLLVKDPFNVLLHNDYNDLLYRLNRPEDYLKSFDRAPPNRGLYLAKRTGRNRVVTEDELDQERAAG